VRKSLVLRSSIQDFTPALGCTYSEVNSDDVLKAFRGFGLLVLFLEAREGQFRQE
jgi:hypothetical protein